MATPAPTATWKNGPTFEQRPATNLDTTPVHFMPSFPPSTVVLPSRSRREFAAIFAIPGDGDNRQLQGHRKDSSAVQRTSIPVANIKLWKMDTVCKDQDLRTDSRGADAYSSTQTQSRMASTRDYSKSTHLHAGSMEPHFVAVTNSFFHKPRSGLQVGRKVERFGENDSKVSQGMAEFKPRYGLQGGEKVEELGENNSKINQGMIEFMPRSGLQVGRKVERFGENDSKINQGTVEFISSGILAGGRMPLRREDAQIPFSDERFFPTDEMLYKLDGSGAYCNSVHSRNPAKFSGRMKMNALKPLPHHHAYSSSNDDPSARVAKYQQNRFVCETILNSAGPVTNMDFPERSQHHPPDPFKMVRSFTPAVSYSASNRSGTVAQENQIDSIPSSGSTTTDFSHLFSDSFIHVLSSPIVEIPCEISSFDWRAISRLPNTSPESKDLLSPLDSGIAHLDSDLPSGKSIFESPASSSMPILLLPDGVILSSIGTPSLADQHDSNLPSISCIPLNSDPVEVGFDRIGSIDDGEVEEEEVPLEGEPEPVALFVPELSTSERSSFKRSGSIGRKTDHVTFSPMVLLFDACFEGELDTVMKTVEQVEDASRPNDDGITALHIAVCAGHFAVVKFLVEFGCNVNAADSDGWMDPSALFRCLQ